MSMVSVPSSWRARWPVLALGTLCGVLALVITIELDVGVRDVAASPSEPPPPPPSKGDDAAAPPASDLDGMVQQILERPLFSAERQAHKEVEEDDTPQPAVRQPPELHGRLEGVLIGPDGKEAIFSRDDDKALAVEEGGEVDGWTVAAIEPDKVKLTSDFGEKVIEPAPGEGHGAQQRPHPPARKAVAVPKPGMPQPRPPNPVPMPRTPAGRPLPAGDRRALTPTQMPRPMPPNPVRQNVNP